MSELFPITNEMRAIFKSNYNGTVESVQIILMDLKEKGFTQMQSLRLIMDEMKLSLSDADNIVMNSSAWKSEKEGNEILRDNFLRAQFLSDQSSKNIDDNLS